VKIIWKILISVVVIVSLYWIAYPMWLWCRAPFPVSQEVEVLNDLKGLRLAMLMYADDHHQKCPTSIKDLKDYHFSSKTIVEVCPMKEWPADYTRVVVVGCAATPLPAVGPPPFLPSWFSIRGWPTNAISARRGIIHNDGSVIFVNEEEFEGRARAACGGTVGL
jgi:hypothetical protein